MQYSAMLLSSNTVSSMRQNMLLKRVSYLLIIVIRENEMFIFYLFVREPW